MTLVRKYGPNKLQNSSLCFGTMQFGDGADEKIVKKCMKLVEIVE